MQGVNPVGWFEIYVQDIEKAKAFYETVLSISMTELPSPTDEPLKMAAFAMGDETMTQTGSSGALCQMDGMPSGGNSTLVYFNCDDCSVEEGRVADAGGSVFRSKMSIGPYGFISLCTDPDGNMFGLHSMN
ncbi:MAG TPA: VOC family protein [Pyrinomonadaceae bacterium]|nr:VOC family protein [Pyrinomonadaceae bacterium]